MCGISGGFTSEIVNDSLIIDLIKHRGPDSDGFFKENKLFLAHTRLSIQDLSSRANQPMYSDDRRYVIVFNGEIYNHLFLRNHLAEFSFKSTSDTETILYSYIKYGEDCFKQFNGIFAIAIYDREKQELMVARDQYGVKPLYLYYDEQMFLFSSEIKSFLAFNIRKDTEMTAISDYLSFLWCPGEKTPLKYVRKLLPGHYIKVKLGDLLTIKEYKYYNIHFDGKYLKSTKQEVVDRLEEKLLKSVERQMLSDVPIGFFLSGGLDSSLLVAMAKRVHPDKKYQCFTIDTFELEKAEGFASDLYYAKKVAKYLDVDLNIVNASIDIVKDFDKMIWHLDEPQSDAAPLNVLQICDYAKEKGIKVLIGGTAGDDLFSGYRRHQALNYEKYFRYIPHGLGFAIKHLLTKVSSKRPLYRRIKKISADLDKPTVSRLIGYFKWIDDSRKNDIFSANVLARLNAYDSTDYFVELLNEIPDERSWLNQMLFLEMRTFMVDHNLNYTDKMSMACGVETRVPFLDIELVKYATQIPPELKMKGVEVKYILKKVAERYLPHDVIYRSKTGFGAPVRKWITEDLENMIAKRLSKENIENRGIFNYNQVWKLIDDNKTGRIDASYTIWSILAIDSWLRQFIDGEKLF